MGKDGHFAQQVYTYVLMALDCMSSARTNNRKCLEKRVEAQSAVMSRSRAAGRSPMSVLTLGIAKAASVPPTQI
jgi:hypothetical protein